MKMVWCESCPCIDYVGKFNRPCCKLGYEVLQVNERLEKMIQYPVPYSYSCELEFIATKNGMFIPKEGD